MYNIDQLKNQHNMGAWCTKKHPGSHTEYEIYCVELVSPRKCFIWILEKQVIQRHFTKGKQQ